MYVYFLKENEFYVCFFFLKEDNKNMYRSCSYGYGYFFVFLMLRVINFSNYYLYIYVFLLFNGL